ncbi:MAG: lamin tail domain-containing protein, partial [Verrucomicrobiales bacterium]
MLHPRGIPLENPKEEWIELHNTSADMVDLSGWQLSKGVQFTIPADTTIPGKGFLILAAEVETFQAIHPEFTGIVLGDWKGRLGNGGDTIRLEDGQGTTVDQLDYATQGEWGLRVKAEEINGSSGWQWWNLADGNGKTYERVQPELAINHAQLWEVSEFSGTPGNTNGLLAEDMAPVILDVKHAPVIPKVAENVTITARIVDDHNAPLTVVVHYRADQRPWQSAELLDPDNDQVHTATIGPFPDALFPTEDAIVEYYIHASDGTHERTWPKPS